MMLCLVTDRRRLAAVFRAADEGRGDLLVAQVAGAVAGGVDIIQIREPDLSASALAALVRRILTEVPESRRRLVVNDRLDVALAVGAGGVHLRERSFGVAAARRMLPAASLVGASVHDPEGAHIRRAADYLIAGTVLPTPSKTPDRLLGWEGLSRVVEAAGSCPVLGIGGLTLATIGPLAATGAVGAAAIGFFIPDQPHELQSFVKKQAELLRLAIDSTRRVP